MIDVEEFCVIVQAALESVTEIDDGNPGSIDWFEDRLAEEIERIGYGPVIEYPCDGSESTQ
jgi:hypothetical protein